MAPKKNYSEEQMQKAIDCVNDGEKISYAAKKYGVISIMHYNITEHCNETASPVSYSGTATQKDSAPGTSRDIYMTAGPPSRTEAKIQNNHKPNESINSLDMTAGPLTSAATPKKKIIKGGIVIPSPFKRNIFWPDGNDSNKKKRKLKEKIPFAIGSPAWRSYHQNKDNEKQLKILEKEKRAEERKEKKRKIEELKNKNIMKKSMKKVNLPISSDETDTEVKYAESDDSLYEEEFNESLYEIPSIDTKCQPESNNIDVQYRVQDPSGSETDNEPLSRLCEKLNTKNKKRYKRKEMGISRGSYVIIKYEREYFPGIVENVNSDNYKVSEMTFSTSNTYRWPNKPDSIWYEEKDNVERIQKPVLINKRGYYEIKEMNKFHTFTTYIFTFDLILI